MMLQILQADYNIQIQHCAGAQKLFYLPAHSYTKNMCNEFLRAKQDDHLLRISQQCFISP